MCGIAGSFAYASGASAVDRGALARMSDAMRARGPDDAGAWYSVDDRVGLVHRRLAIIDLSDEAAQPMISPDGRLVVTFNGEIYNYQALRHRLEQRGHVFGTSSDTEVLLHLYLEYGEDMVHELRGMYAFAIWDAAERALLLARDPYGIKPLFYSNRQGTLSFASQVKPLRACPTVSSEIDSACLVGFYLFGSVPEPFSIHRDIRALPAGTWMRVDERGVQEPKVFFSVANVFAQSTQGAQVPSQEEQQALTREALLDSVRAHLVSDVPVGAFLSAGIDSGALVGLMKEAGQREVRTVTLAFDEFRGTHDDEALLAEQVATHYGTTHTTRYVSRDEFEQDLPRILEAMDQPTIDGVNIWFVSKAATEQGLKVALSGLGGDELFGGYPSFSEIPRWTRMLGLTSRLPQVGRFARKCGEALFAQRTVSPKAWGMIEYGGTYPGGYLLRRGLFMPWELDNLVGPEIKEDGLRRLQPLEHIGSVLAPDPKTAFGRVATMEAGLYMKNQLLRDSDWASMAHSLEVRVPLVDKQLLTRLAPALSSKTWRLGKGLLANSVANPLPDAVVQRRKTGFVTPLGHWLLQAGEFGTKGLNSGLQVRGHWTRLWAAMLGRSLAEA